MSHLQPQVDLLQLPAHGHEPVLVVPAGTMLAGAGLFDNTDPWPFPDMFRPVSKPPWHGRLHFIVRSRAVCLQPDE